MGKERGSSWIKSLKKAIHHHIHGDIDEDIVRFPHLPHKKSQLEVKTAKDRPAACCSGSPRRTCTCSCRDNSASSQVSIMDGRSTSSVESTSSSNGGSFRSTSLSDCYSSTGSCSINCACSTSNSRRLHPLGDRRPPTEEPMLHEVDDRETIATLVNLWGPH